jgi:hypothetical protein
LGGRVLLGLFPKIKNKEELKPKQKYYNKIIKDTSFTVKQKRSLFLIKVKK